MGKFNLQLTFLASPLFSSPTTRYRESGIRQPQHHPHLNGHHLTSHSLNLFLSPIINKPPHPNTCRRLEAANFSHQIKIQQLLSIPTKLRGGSCPPRRSKLLDWRILSIWKEPGNFFGVLGTISSKWLVFIPQRILISSWVQYFYPNFS